MEKTLVFDMDGTLADFYGVDGWLENLQEENPRPYRVAKPMISIRTFKREIKALRADGWGVKVVTWGSKTSSPAFLKATEKAKMGWLKRHKLLDQIDVVKVVPYGTPKSTMASGILFDDEERNCAEWTQAGGRSVNVTEEDMINALKSLR